MPQGSGLTYSRGYSYVSVVPSFEQGATLMANRFKRRLKAANGRAAIVGDISIWINQQSAKLAVQRWLYSNETQKKIRDEMPRSGGVLLVLIFHEADTVIGQARYFKTGFVFGGGRNPKDTLQRYLDQDKLMAVPPGSMRRVEEYVWVSQGPTLSFSPPELECTPDNPTGR